jgi:hypothetical protein
MVGTLAYMVGTLAREIGCGIDRRPRHARGVDRCWPGPPISTTPPAPRGLAAGQDSERPTPLRSRPATRRLRQRRRMPGRYPRAWHAGSGWWRHDVLRPQGPAGEHGEEQHGGLCHNGVRAFGKETASGGRLIFGAIAEFERNLIRERTQVGLVAARARGGTGGRPAKMTPTRFGRPRRCEMAAWRSARSPRSSGSVVRGCIDI